MANFMKPFDTQLYAVLRIILGFCFLWHGSQKLLGFPGAAPDGIPDAVLFIAGPIELIGGILIMIGLMTRWAAFLSSGLMAAAYWMAHGMQAPLPILNGGELAVLYCFAFLFVAAHGSGIWSVDSMRGGGGKT